VWGSRRRSTNDLSGTDYTFGFDTAVTIATEAIDRLHTTAESHNRVMVVEVMGRHTGWIAVMSGIAGGADVILIPEQPITVEDACAGLVKRHDAGKDFSIVVVSEGYELTYASGEQKLVAEEARSTDQFGHVVLGGVGTRSPARSRSGRASRRA
jgi:6-phosphofructokinase 1